MYHTADLPGIVCRMAWCFPWVSERQTTLSFRPLDLSPQHTTSGAPVRSPKHTVRFRDRRRGGTRKSRSHVMHDRQNTLETTPTCRVVAWHGMAWPARCPRRNPRNNQKQAQRRSIMICTFVGPWPYGMHGDAWTWRGGVERGERRGFHVLNVSWVEYSSLRLMSV